MPRNIAKTLAGIWQGFTGERTIRQHNWRPIENYLTCSNGHDHGDYTDKLNCEIHQPN